MYSFESRVRYSECDGDGRLSLLAMVNYLQDCSTFQSEELGLGLEFMRERHFAWFISAWLIEIRSLPRFCDPITVSTWCYETSRARAGRNFSICSADGTPHVLADSLWFTFDTQALRPTRVPTSEQAYLQGDERIRELPPIERRLPVKGSFREAERIVVGSQHLDTNGHVNNAQYVLMATQALDVSIKVHRLCVQYRRMALVGDTLIPRIHEGKGSWTVDLASPEGDTFATIRIEGERTEAGSR